MPNMKGDKYFKSFSQSRDCMQKNFDKKNFDVCQLFTPSLKHIYVSVLRTCSMPLLDFMQTNSDKCVQRLQKDWVLHADVL